MPPTDHIILSLFPESHSPPMSTATATAAAAQPPSPLEQQQEQEPEPILIPSLPNEVALSCIARIPRSQHAIVSLVSKPFRSLLSSTLFYTTRSLLNSTQHSLYLCLRIPTNPSLLFFTLNQSPRTDNYIFTPIPSLPSPRLIGSAFAVVGHKIYVMGGSVNDVPSQHVWALDCRFHSWEKATNMHIGREFSVAGVVDTKIYVIGGCVADTWAKSRNWAEVFDPKTGSWSPVASDIEFREKWMHASAVVDDKIYAMGDRGGVRYDPRNLSWESVESEIDMGWRGRACVVDGVLYCYDYLGKIRGFDVKRGAWKELRGVEKGLPRFLSGATMANLGGKLVVVWEASGGNEKGKELGIWCAEIEVEKHGDGELWGKVCWSGLVLSVPSGSSIVNCVAVAL